VAVVSGPMKTCNHAMQPKAYCTSFEVGQPSVRPG
jgi:hypothetical protein